MPRSERCPGGIVYHILNRGAGGMQFFEDDAGMKEQRRRLRDDRHVGTSRGRVCRLIGRRNGTDVVVP